MRVLENPFEFVRGFVFFTFPQERLASPGKFAKGGEGGWTVVGFCKLLKGEIILCVWERDFHSLTIRCRKEGQWFERHPSHAFSSPDLFAVRERIYESDLDPPTLPAFRQPSPSLSPGVQWADLAAIQSQLQIQSQVCDHLFDQARCARWNIWCVCLTEFIHFFPSCFQGNWVSHPETPWNGKGKTVSKMSYSDTTR